MCRRADCAGAVGGRASRHVQPRNTTARGALTQLGTAFLLADKAGTHPAYRRALQDHAFSETVVTRSFTGRYARGLRNRFIAAPKCLSVTRGRRRLHSVEIAFECLGDLRMRRLHADALL